MCDGNLFRMINDIFCSVCFSHCWWSHGQLHLQCQRKIATINRWLPIFSEQSAGKQADFYLHSISHEKVRINLDFLLYWKKLKKYFSLKIRCPARVRKHTKSNKIELINMEHNHALKVQPKKPSVIRKKRNVKQAKWWK